MIPLRLFDLDDVMDPTLEISYASPEKNEESPPPSRNFGGWEIATPSTTVGCFHLSSRFVSRPQGTRKSKVGEVQLYRWWDLLRARHQGHLLGPPSKKLTLFLFFKTGIHIN